MHVRPEGRHILASEWDLTAHSTRLLRPETTCQCCTRSLACICYLKLGSCGLGGNVSLHIGLLSQYYLFLLRSSVGKTVWMSSKGKRHQRTAAGRRQRSPEGLAAICSPHFLYRACLVVEAENLVVIWELGRHKSNIQVAVRWSEVNSCLRLTVT
jgi:hypothetical protein